MKKHRLLVVLALIAVIIGSCGRKASETSQSSAAVTPTPEKSMAKINSRLVKGWMIGLTNRRPGLDAKRGVALGQGALGVAATPNAVAWFEMVDIDSNGTPEKVGFMWDATSKVIYAYTHDPVTLDDGSTADKGLLVAQFGDGNTKNRPMGSGFWAYATSRDTTSATEVAGTLYGCRFDKYGEETECGPGTWSRVNNDFDISTKVK
jgi:hypothetical protein